MRQLVGALVVEVGWGGVWGFEGERGETRCQHLKKPGDEILKRSLLQGHCYPVRICSEGECGCVLQAGHARELRQALEESHQHGLISGGHYFADRPSSQALVKPGISQARH
jgi:hypothetical protein